jgi:hypothetical protein
MDEIQQARLVMEALAVLHKRGYGHLKLYCYVQDGLGAWPHWVFASDEFPDNIRAWPGPKCFRNFHGAVEFNGGTAEEVADSVLAQCPNVAEAARGHDEIYVTWYREMLAAYPDGILEMVSAHRARIYDCDDEVRLPTLKAWTNPPPTPLSPEQVLAAREANRQSVMERARQRRLKRGRST